MNSNKSVTVSNVEVTVKPVKKRNIKKFVLISIFTILLLCSLGGWGVFAGYYYIDKNNPEILYWLNIKERPKNTTEEKVETPAKNEGKNTDGEVPSNTPKPKIYSVDDAKSSFGLKFTFIGTPEKISNFPLIGVCQETNCGDYKDADFSFYKVGTVLSGYVKGINVTGFDNLVIINDKKNNASFNPYLRLFISPDRTEGVVIETNIAWQMIGFEWVTSIKDATDSYSINPMEFGLMNFEKPSFVPTANYVGGLDKNNIFYSGVKVKYFRNVSFVPKQFSTYSVKTEVDKIGDNSVYQGDNGLNYIKSLDGFVFEFMIYPDLLEPKDILTYEIIPQITWKDTTKNTGLFDFYNIGKCGVYGAVLEIVAITKTDLIEVGKASNGVAVYTYKNSNDPYLKKIYNEDYIATAMNKFNTTKEDDLVPFNYDQFLAHHPIFFYFDNFGRAIRFVNRDFVFTGGCAKPAVYVYGKAGTELEVKVVPTGEFRFTLPKIVENSWKVVLGDNENLLSKAASEGSFDYLWYESTASNIVAPKEWMSVNSSDYSQKIEAYLVSAGLNDKESADFMEYWTTYVKKGVVENGGKLYVSFLVDTQVNQIAKLSVMGVNGNIVAMKERRVFMLLSNSLLSGEMEVVKLDVSTFNRSEKGLDGVEVIEWGGGWR
jgi:hypothetical protein